MSQDRRLIAAELRKAFGANPWFWVSLLAGLALAVISAARTAMVFQNTLEMALKYWDKSDALYSATSCFAFWMPVDPSQWAMGVYLLVWPLLAALPYAWSWSAEKNAGLVAQQVARVPRVSVFVAKAFAAFLSGAAAVAAPLLANLVMCACICPASPNWVSDVLYLGVTSDAVFSTLFYNAPLAFCLIWTLVVALVAGLWAVLVLTLTMLLDNFAPTLVASYLVLHVLSYVGSQLSTIALAQVGESVARSALLSLNLFSVVGVRSQPDAAAALLAGLVAMAIGSVGAAAFALKRDVL